MSNRNRNRVVYPEEKEFKTKDANNKLKSQVRSLKKALKIAESDNKTLSRAFDKSCEIIKNKLEGYSLEQVLQMIEDYEYKETEKGRRRDKIAKEKKENQVDKEDTPIFNSQNCPKCGKNKEKGFSIMKFEKFTISSCSCGYRLKADNNEGIERS